MLQHGRFGGRLLHRKGVIMCFLDMGLDFELWRSNRSATSERASVWARVIEKILVTSYDIQQTD